MDKIETDRMHCMEVWGGNKAVHRGFEMSGLKAWIYSEPFRHANAGGDVYYVSSCASGRITRMLLADVSGHGDAAANIAVGLRDLMRRNVNLVSQRRFVREMNKQFTSQQEACVFATALVCSFFAPTRNLQFCNAGHPTPLLYRMAENTWISAQDVASETPAEGLSDTPLGIAQGANYSRFETKLGQGDMVLCFSDAFTESLDRCGNMMQTRGIQKLLEDIDTSVPSTVISQLVHRVNEQNSRNLLQDDATILLFCADGTNPTVSDNLLAPFRLLRRPRDTVSLTP